MKQRIYVALDLETTGFDPKRRGIIEIGAVKFQGGQILERFETFVNPQHSIPIAIQQLTGIRNEDVVGAPTINEVLPEFRAFVDRQVAAVIAHNTGFDLGFLRAAGLTFAQPALDTVELASILLPNQASYNLGQLCLAQNIPLDHAHRALADAEATAQLFMQLMARLDQLPAPILNTILHYGTYSQSPSLFPLEVTEPTQWTLLRLFQDAAQARQRSPALATHGPTALPHTIHGAHPLQTNGYSDGDSLDDSPAAYPSVDSSESIDGKIAIDQILGPEGLLAQQMGDAFEFRAGQVEMAQRIWQAFETNDHLIIEAETGTGKSLAYLVAAALWAKKSGERIVIATNTRTLQDQLVDKDIPQLDRLLSHALPDSSTVTSTVLKGRRNYLCLARLIDWLHRPRQGQLFPTELRVLSKILVWLPTTRTGDFAELMIANDEERSIVRQLCSDGAICNRARCTSLSGPIAELWRWLTKSVSEKNRAIAMPDFYQAAHERAENADLLVVNHALLVADLSSGERLLPEYTRLIIDEGHRFDEAATQQLTYQVDWEAARRDLGRLAPKHGLLHDIETMAPPALRQRLYTPLTGMEKSLRRLFDGWDLFLETIERLVSQLDSGRHTGYAQRVRLDSSVRAQPGWSRVEIDWENLSLQLVKLLEYGREIAQQLGSAGWTKQDPHATQLNRLVDALNSVETFADQVNQAILNRVGQGDGMVAWLEVSKSGTRTADSRKAQAPNVRLFIAPVWVNTIIEETLVQQKKTLVLTGATLRVAPSNSSNSVNEQQITKAQFGYTKDLLGLWDVNTAVVESPFNYEQNVLLLMPADMPPPNHPNYQSAVEHAMIAAASASKRTLALFTNYSQVKATAKALRHHFHGSDISILEHGRNGRQRLLNEFRDSAWGILLGTRTFWEGIDLPGDEIETLVMARLPFAVPDDPLIAARSEIAMLDNENPFETVQLPEAVLKFRQGFGRLIRRQSDRGVVLLLDSRLWQKSYGQAFLNSLPTCHEEQVSLDSIEDEIKRWLE